MIILDAVNTSLRYLGEMPIPPSVDIDSLDDLHEAKIIRTTLAQVSREQQAKGWWFNRENWTFLPDSTTGKIAVPASALSVRGVTDSVVQRGNTLYSYDNTSYDFTDSVDCVVIWDVPFEDLPATFAELITYITARDVQAFLRGDSTADQRLEQKIRQAYINTQKEDIAFSQYNFISGTRLIGRDSRPTAVS